MVNSKQPTANRKEQNPDGRQNPDGKQNPDGEDIISTLNDDILIQILSCMPTDDAIRIGILSKRWVNLWSHVNSLSFVSLNSIRSGAGFCKFVDRALSLHSRNRVSKFSLNFHYFYDLRYCPRIISWIDWAIAANVEEFDLRFLCFWSYEVPVNLLTYSSLNKLVLWSGFLKFPSVQIRWDSLKFLSLNCTVTQKFLDNLFSGSPVLESLELLNCYKIRGVFRFPSPALKKLVLKGYFTLTQDGPIIEAPYIHSFSISGQWPNTIQFGNLSSLNTAIIHLHLTQHVLNTILERFSHVKELFLENCCLWSLTRATDLAFLSSLECTKLTLNVNLLSHHFPIIVEFLRDSCVLESLSIRTTLYFSRLIFSGKKCNNAGKNYLEQCNTRPLCLPSSLKTVNITHSWFDPVRDEAVIALLQFLLKEACVLEKIFIQSSTKRSMPSKLKDRLLSFPKSSPHAMIILN